jgi:Zn-dependent peptidase ImmA (M78 family)/DNA-binding XRE family transcriptional regulator
MSDDGPELTLFHDIGPPPPLQTIAQAFEPARLTQARVLCELTKGELAELVGVSPAAIGQYESGATRPRPDLIPTLARRLQVPSEFFATGRPLGRLDVANVHFRSLRSTRAKDRAKAAAHAEQLWELTYALEKRIRFPELDLPTVPEGCTPTEAAALLRRTWGLTPGPVPHLAAIMESRGIVVSLIPLTNAAINRVKAYSTNELGRPLVIITPERFQSVYDYRFACAHELGHLLLHPSPLPGDRQQEREADQFAAAFLTPGDEIRAVLPKTARIAALDKLSKIWGVPIESLIYRMGELRLVSEASIRRAHQTLAGMADLRQEEPLSSYPGEVPTLLREALELIADADYDQAHLATELRWRVSHITEVLGETDVRPALRAVT